MGFIPLPLGVVMIRVISNAVRGNSRGAPLIVLLAYLCLVTFRFARSYSDYFESPHLAIGGQETPVLAVFKAGIGIKKY